MLINQRRYAIALKELLGEAAYDESRIPRHMLA